MPPIGNEIIFSLNAFSWCFLIMFSIPKIPIPEILDSRPGKYSETNERLNPND